MKLFMNATGSCTQHLLSSMRRIQSVTCGLDSDSHISEALGLDYNTLQTIRILQRPGAKLPEVPRSERRSKKHARAPVLGIEMMKDRPDTERCTKMSSQLCSSAELVAPRKVYASPPFTIKRKQSPVKRGASRSVPRRQTGCTLDRLWEQYDNGSSG
jgi:hypothetical protein